MKTFICSVHLQVVAMMHVGNLPLPLPILTPALHADFPSVHIGIKVSWPDIYIILLFIKKDPQSEPVRHFSLSILNINIRIIYSFSSTKN